MLHNWLSNNYIEVFGAVTGIVYVFFEIRQNIWLWPVGIVTSAIYIWVFFVNKFYADMGLMVYYLIISILGWYWWSKGAGQRAEGRGQGAESTGSEMGRVGEEEIEAEQKFRESGQEQLQVTRLKLTTGVILTIVFVFLYFAIWYILTRLTDSPVPARDSLITSLSIIATWMLARKIFEHWFLWIVVNFVSAVIFLTRGLYPTVILYVVYGIMSFAGFAAWKKTIKNE